MTKRYDAIVIGAGLGGLAAATTLAHSGLEVLLLERHNVPGGYASSFVRGRYEFEVALHELSGIGPPERRGNVYRTLEHLGVTDKVEFLHVPELYRCVYLEPSDTGPSAQKLDITLPVGQEEFESTLAEFFPHEAQGTHRFMARVFAFGRDYAQYLRQRRTVQPVSLPFRFPHLFRYLPTTWGQVLDRDVQDPAARAVLSGYWGYAGMPPSKISFMSMASTLAAYVRRGAAFPKGRSQALSNAFLARFEELGGEARMNCGVRRITASNGRVTGVVTEEDQEIQADWIVSNADPIATCRDMIGFEHVPSSFFTGLQSSEVAASTINVYLGVARPTAELGFSEHEIFVSAGYDADRHYELMKTIAPPEAIAVTCYNVVYPDISPPGTSIVVLTALAFGEPWTQVPPAEYVATKNRMADAMIDMAEQIAPGLRKYAEVVEVSTPLTNMRYANALGGSIYGFSQPPRDHMAWRMDYKGPLDRLYFAGAWTRPGGGFEPTMMSGVRAGRSISFKAKKQEGA
jgi:phytoene dehydrogenase-like protein